MELYMRMWGEKIVATLQLTRGVVQSCGCLHIEQSKINIQKSVDKQRKVHPTIATAKVVWKKYLKNDPNCNLTFKQWYDLSQQNCFYCGILPSNKFNYFLSKKTATLFSKENGYFIYNGIDRVNNNLSHTIDNVVPCCWICNRAKNNRDIFIFYEYINNLQINDYNSFKLNEILELPTDYSLSSLKGVLHNYNKEIDIKIFYTLSQLPCFYCKAVKTNCRNQYLNDSRIKSSTIKNAYFYYNGIDRIDNNLGHISENCVPCCINCNFAKSNMTFIDFQNWITRIKEHQIKKIAHMYNMSDLI